LSILPDELPQIDESFPGSAPDENDGATQQLDTGETLDPRALADNLDEGYVPPDRPSRINVPTESEEEAGESLDDRLAEEEPDVGAEEYDILDESGPEVGDERSGRLIDVDDPDGDLTGEDIGIDGAAATAEEAAVHVVDAP
jgi:hypothetical protein